MTLDETIRQIQVCAKQMDAHYNAIVFDEWAVISLTENKARVLAYIGPRKDDFQKNFTSDVSALRRELHDMKYGVGDFEFERQGVGTVFEAFMVLGAGFYLICNNTRDSMDNIAKKPAWLTAQVPFAELSERIRPDPLVISWDEPRHSGKN